MAARVRAPAPVRQHAGVPLPPLLPDPVLRGRPRAGQGGGDGGDPEGGRVELRRRDRVAFAKDGHLRQEAELEDLHSAAARPRGEEKEGLLTYDIRKKIWDFGPSPLVCISLNL